MIKSELLVDEHCHNCAAFEYEVESYRTPNGTQIDIICKHRSMCRCIKRHLEKISAERHEDDLK